MQKKRLRGDLVVVSVKMPRALRTRLNVYRAKAESSLQDIVAEAIEEYLRNKTVGVSTPRPTST